MAVYVYRCLSHGRFDSAHPIGTAPSAVPCPHCSASAARVLTSPNLSSTSAAVTAMMDAHGRSQTAPAVTTRPPEPERPSRPADPRIAKLPRP
ncbi:zinc ribbon domain-containing protein [Rhodococcus sp. Z13]|uniref:Zinc ribbon domain-containing protein n=1 Tax=Rhodococcus sacchari TaxID=2962047 RepID=A0ACD4DK60_9NOCA|nr:zinc ribbon domain-containing protein [Rhodococcus sp. Z13]UYP20432.1 zinc ribbon domain-containing protein [Rhodococcus sp. Z13]